MKNVLEQGLNFWQWFMKFNSVFTHVFMQYMEPLRPINIKRARQLTQTTLFFLRKEKRAARVGFEPTTHCLLGRCSNH